MTLLTKKICGYNSPAELWFSFIKILIIDYECQVVKNEQKEIVQKIIKRRILRILKGKALWSSWGTFNLALFEKYKFLS